MTKFVEKTESDLAWAEIRREVQYRINLAAAHWRARKANEILPALQGEFEKHLTKGVVSRLDPGTSSWVDEALKVDA